MKNLYAGRRCFVIGNGPGLDRYDLGLLQGEITFGSNMIFRRFIPSHYVCVNPLVLDQFFDEIESLETNKFIDLPFTSEVGFCQDPAGPFWQGYTVTFVSLQLAFIMGCDPVFLIGCDHDYGDLDGDPNSEEVAEWTAHASGLGYAGHRWNLPDLERSYEAYRLAAANYWAAGRRIYIIPPTKLDLFEEVSWEDVIG